MKNSTYCGRSGKRSTMALAIITAILGEQALAAETNAPLEVAQNVEFNDIFLNVKDRSSIDLSRFANGASAQPGVYRAVIYVNGDAALTTNVEVRASDSDKTTYPCLSRDIVKSLPFNYDKLPVDFLKGFDRGEPCLDLVKRAPNSRINFDTNDLRLDLSIPQIYVQKSARGSVNPELWDSGIPALLLGYHVNSYSSRSYGETYNSTYAGINAGLNIGAWYLRHNGSYNRYSNSESKYSAINTYLQRDIPAIKGRALIGESNTQGTVFDTLPFKGVHLFSDERMLPESLRGYAPDIRGVARTNARVTVSQSNQVIYETTVSPGEFLINDLYPTGYGGDLDVTVHEADGSEQSFKVPYASVPQQLRPGSARYALTAGKYNLDGLKGDPDLYQATYQYGINNSLTGYGGAQGSDGYYALQLGAAFGTPIGSLALDVTQARTTINKTSGESDETLNGQSYRASFSKDISQTQSNVSIAAYRFSTSGFLDYQTAMAMRDAAARNDPNDAIWRPKNRFILTASQGLPDEWGQLYVSGSLQNYWNKDGSDKQFQMGYSNVYNRISYGINVNRTYSNGRDAQTNYMLTVSLPLWRDLSRHAPTLNLNLNHDSDGRSRQQVGISGTAGEHSQLGYSVSATSGNQGQGSSGSINAQYRSQMAALGAGYSTGKHYSSVSASFSGTVIGHSGGVTFTPYTSDTFALVEAKGAQGAAVSSYPGIYVDYFGYAAVPYLNAYQFNNVYIDPKEAPEDVELDTTSQKVAPHLGAVVKLKYNAKSGAPVLIAARHLGESVPFGADVIDDQGNSVGAVGQGGVIYARVAKEHGSLTVKWGDAPDAQCAVGYRLMPQAKGQREIQRFDAECKGPRQEAGGAPYLLSAQSGNGDALPNG